MLRLTAGRSIKYFFLIFIALSSLFLLHIHTRGYLHIHNVHLGGSWRQMFLSNTSETESALSLSTTRLARKVPEMSVTETHIRSSVSEMSTTMVSVKQPTATPVYDRSSSEVSATPTKDSIKSATPIDPSGDHGILTTPVNVSGDVSTISPTPTLRLTPSFKLSTLPPSLANMSAFDSIVNNNVCVENNSNILAVILVMSTVANLNRRNVIREAYPAEELNKLGIRRLFVLATLVEDMDKHGFMECEIDEESNAHKDMLLINNAESDRYLGYKTLMGLKYTALYCSDVSFVIKTDESVFYDVYKLIDILKAVPEENRDKLFGNTKETDEPVRDVRFKSWYVSKEEYPSATYPTYCTSFLYFTSTQTAGVLVETSSLVPYLKIEDVFVTGLVAQEAGVPRKDIGGELSYGKSLRCCRNNEKNIVYKCAYLAAFVDEEVVGKTKSHLEYCFSSKNCTDLGDSGKVEKLECF